MNANSLRFLVIAFFCAAIFEAQKEANWVEKIKILTDGKYLSGKSEIVFLLDRSGSVGQHNFEIEKGFVESLLQHFVISPNATRVAVITYSSDVVVHIDYVKDPKNRCFLAQELQAVQFKNSGATNIASALDQARDVLKNARPDVHKVVILLSDGLHTHPEGDPKESAKKLIDENVDVFAFGVGSAWKDQLTSLVKSKDCMFYCEDFKEFEQLAQIIRGDPHETAWSFDDGPRGCDSQCNSPYRGMPEDPGCCDHSAKCSCSLQTGHRTCVCGPGYYGLRGQAGDCKACPIGTYKDKYEPSRYCEQCPLHSTTENEASTSIKDCKCVVGYEGNPAKGTPCEMKSCPPLQDPKNGHLSVQCGNKFGSICFFDCKDGYELQRADSRKRVCQDSKEWSGSTAVCQKIRCAEPVPPRFGSKVCSSRDFTVGTICTFSCNPGYLLLGEAKHTCRENKQWIPDMAECIAVTCPALKPVNHLMMSNCRAEMHYQFDHACLFSCPKGFELVGPHVTFCSEKGKWIGNDGLIGQPYCRDVMAPRIDCPPSVRLPTDKGKDYTLFQWRKPVVSDNSGFEPKLTWDPPFKESDKFYIGSHRIKFQASDRDGFVSTCESSIGIEDREPPRIKFCPSNIELNTTDFEIEVFWEKPKFWDNSRQNIDIAMTANPGSKFSPGKHTVVYIATDKSGNEARCSFDVVISKTSCPYHPPPVNGAIACKYWFTGELCEVYCNDLFEFSSVPADSYICDASNRWKTIPANYPIPWPDCSEWYVPKVKRVFRGHYFAGNCHDPRVQKAIKEAYMKHFEEKFDTTKFCKTKGSCLIDSIKVTCGKVNFTIPVRPKRDVWRIPIDDTIEIEVEITVSNERSSAADVDELVTTINEILQNMKDGEDNPSLNEIDTDMMLQDAFSLDIDDPILICLEGAVLRGEECVNCPLGSYHNIDKELCEDCPLGYYQDEEASVECIPCPNGTRTENIGSKNATDCKEICLPGTYSSTGLATCNSCPSGTYQPLSQQTYCIGCPENSTTAVDGADSQDDCSELCSPGSYSETGLMPCFLCSMGTFQEEYGSSYCYPCPGNLTTTIIGSESEGSCVEYDHCSEDPCLNNGDCISDQHNFTCVCQHGYSGELCEVNIDDCLYSPCAEGSTCIDGVATYFCVCPPGFAGALCDQEVNECESSPCQNYGICVDEVGKFQCLCLPGYEGQFCENDIDMCQKFPCANGAHCEEVDNTRVCTCQPGFEGENCSINVDDCATSICLNGGSCIDGIRNYTCACAPGFLGRHCEINFDECFSHYCQNGATCIDGINAYSCHCPPGFSGIYCEQKLSPNFVMTFDRPSTSNYAIINNLPPMSSTSVGMWVQTSDRHNQGTMISYAANNQLHRQVPNALTMTDYGSLKIYVNDKPIYTGLKLNDGQWHHIAFTWSSENGGWKLYHNGSVLATGEGIETGGTIPGGGSLIVGQEQDCVGGEFSSVESFTGNISRVNLWNRVLSQQDIRALCRLKEIPGHVTAWPDFQGGINGNIRITNSDAMWE